MKSTARRVYEFYILTSSSAPSLPGAGCQASGRPPVTPHTWDHLDSCCSGTGSPSLGIFDSWATLLTLSSDLCPGIIICELATVLGQGATLRPWLCCGSPGPQVAVGFSTNAPETGSDFSGDALVCSRSFFPKNVDVKDILSLPQLCSVKQT